MEKLKRLFILMTLLVFAFQYSTSQVLTALAFNSGDVVINEIAWAGSNDDSVDEWIELYNTTNQTIDLTGWYIEDDTTTQYLISSGTIEPHGYFLIEDSEIAISNVDADLVIGISLANAGDSLVLRDNTDVVIDTVNGGGGAWYAGDSTTRASMERIDPSILLDSVDNWATANSSNGALGRAGSEILGTPGGPNSNFGGSGPEVSINPVELNAANGDQITFSVDISSVTDLYAYGFEIHYDSNVISFVSANEGDFLNVDGASTAFNAALENGDQGVLIVGNARLVNPPQGIDGSGKLFDIVFDVTGANGSSSEILFTGSNFISDSVSEIPFSLNSASMSVGVSSVDQVLDPQVQLGVDRYSIELTWNPGASGADYYVVKKQMYDGNYVVVGEPIETNFIDNDSLVPGTIYNYQIFAVKGTSYSNLVEISGMDNRGLTGDIDRSDRVDGRDIEKLARSYGSEYGDEEYDLKNDLNFDGIIDGNDLIDIGINFGLTY